MLTLDKLCAGTGNPDPNLLYIVERCVCVWGGPYKYSIQKISYAKFTKGATIGLPVKRRWRADDNLNLNE